MSFIPSTRLGKILLTWDEESLSNWDVGGISLGCKTKAVRECTVVELKALLRLRGQKTSGLKAQLRNRLSANERRQ